MPWFPGYTRNSWERRCCTTSSAKRPRKTWKNCDLKGNGSRFTLIYHASAYQVQICFRNLRERDEMMRYLCIFERLHSYGYYHTQLHTLKKDTRPWWKQCTSQDTQKSRWQRETVDPRQDCMLVHVYLSLLHPLVWVEQCNARKLSSPGRNSRNTSWEVCANLLALRLVCYLFAQLLRFELTTGKSGR